ncbi:hypothetical protein HHI36_011163 [Cryptolaemus montrouzieri]|uniref:Uncharacterized protein n=1 Tax=Cryptolaemus montrouzieri TaxID=559131 RepID=A0ABD2MKU6_9CUCU
MSDKFNQLECFLATSKAPDVFCITESRLDHLECSSFGRTQHRRGGAIILCEDRNYSSVDEINCLSVEIDCEVAALRLEDTDITILTFYHSPKVENLSAGVVRCDFSDHRIQQVQMVIAVTVPGVLSKKCRPLTEKGFFDMHNNLQNQIYGLLGTEHVDAFRAFQQSFRAAFPERTRRNETQVSSG